MNIVSKNSLHVSIIIWIFFISFGFSKSCKAAYEDFTKNLFHRIKYSPRFSLEGLVGDHKNIRADFYLPLFSQDKNNLYLDAGMFYGKGKSSIWETGFGWRKISGEEIIGSYLFASYNSHTGDSLVPRDQHFLVLNPGFEILGTTWDFAINGYFPIHKNHWLLREGWADQFNIFSYIKFHEHSMYNLKVQEHANLGNGVDASIGSIMPGLTRLKIYGGAYYFKMHADHDVCGWLGKATFTINKRLTLIANNIYDSKQRNTFTIGLSLTFGGINTTEQPEITERLLDPVRHDWLWQNYNSTVPITLTKQIKKPLHTNLEPELNNIYFFRDIPLSDTENGDGTYEHPFCYQNFTQNFVNATNDASNFFIAGPGKINIFPELSLKDGQSIYGRSNDFVEPAQNEDRSLLVGSIRLNGNNHLDSLRLENDSQLIKEGITINGFNRSKDTILNNIKIGSAEEATKSYQTAIDIADCAYFKLLNSEIYAYDKHGLATAYGIKIRNSDVDIVNSLITSSTLRTGAGNQNATSYGLYADHARVMLNDSKILSFAHSISLADGNANGSSYGIYALNNSVIKVTSSASYTNISAEAIGENNNAPASGTSFGIYIAASLADISMSNIISKGVGQSANPSFTAGFGYGIFAKDASSVAIKNSNITGIGLGSKNTIGDGFGVRSENSYLVLEKSVMKGLGNCNAYGIYIAENEENFGSKVNLIDVNNFFIAHNLETSGNAYGFYSRGNNDIFGDYQDSKYDVSGGANSANWYLAI